MALRKRDAEPSLIMMQFYASNTKGPIAVDTRGDTIPDPVNWIDAFNPTDEEMGFLERTLKVHVPSKDDLVEIESSSRLSTEGETIIMSLPATTRDETGYPKTTPIGFVVSRQRLVTIRFEHLPSFENLSKQICERGALSAGGLGATITIIEIIVDHLADLLERVGGTLDAMSHEIFASGHIAGKNRRPRQSNDALKTLLNTVGRSGDLLSKVSESLLGLSRMGPYLTAKSGDTVTPDFKTRLEMIGLDAKSLHEFQDHLVSKTQFLLDTLLGLANIEQNNVFRVLTVVSVVGIPPTFFASLYGMNFKTIPEYDWTYGYAYGLTLIALSAIIPAVWFKVKGWW